MLTLLVKHDEGGVRYRAVPGFPGYCAGDDGSVWSCLTRCNSQRHYSARWHPLKPRSSGGDYVFVVLSREDKSCKSMAVHRVVLFAFAGPPQEGQEARHLDGNSVNNRLSNLAWGTPAENYDDRRRHGTDNGGRRNGSAKLTVAQVREIRKRHMAGECRKSILARYAIGRTTLDSIVNGQSWKDA